MLNITNFRVLATKLFSPFTYTSTSNLQPISDILSCDILSYTIYNGYITDMCKVKYENLSIYGYYTMYNKKSNFFLNNL